ncbi:hypothetical protein KDW_63100 [Dictyobacter vulcani]|uniref:Radical SAM core domain-containing protein n=1 Tax=Dictyobacter vulcani TaxID=2607529 RepID=A0A5J4KR08_9CHLR|nr:radical SAM protein [Dictyobacter vulcani]GER92148.1 hypothetical protein KDW_63100 [Dictyobacter vulcani]
MQPARLGRLAVLDAHAFFVLEKFRDGNTPSEVAEATFIESLTAIEQFAALLYNSGFLQDTQLSATNNRKQEETLAVWLHVTNACNLRCNYCYISKTNEIMADDTARKSVDAIFRSALKQGFKHIMLKYAGGEASLQAESIFAIHDYAIDQARFHNIELDAHLLSNGVFLSQRMIEQLKKRKIAVSISLDGIGAAHDSQRSFSNGKGSFKFVDRTITRLLANEVTPHILVTVSQHNLAGLSDLMAYILQYNLSFSLSYYRDNECSPSSNNLQFSDAQMITTMQNVFAFIEQRLPRQSLLNSLIDKADLTHSHQQTCGVGRNYLVIDQHGGVAKCQADIKHTITTIDEDDPLQILKTDLTGIQNLPVEQKQGCQQCNWRNWCAGGCPLLTYRITGRYDIKSPNCNIYQALIPEALRLEALRLLAYEEPFIIHEVTEEHSLVL